MDNTSANGLSLFDQLIQLVDCNYISDLYSSEFLPSVCKAITTINEEDYSIQQWNEAVCYITRIETAFDSVNEAKHFIQNWYQSVKKD